MRNSKTKGRRREQGQSIVETILMMPVLLLFLLNAVNWLADDPGQIGARPEMQQSGVHQFYMSAEQGRTVLLLSTAVLPGFFWLVGVSIFVWRRQRG